MSSINESSPEKIVDGKIAILLKFIKDQTIVSLRRLEKSLANEFNTDEEFSKVMSHSISSGLIQESAGSYKLTKYGASWLQEEGDSLSIEYEDHKADDEDADSDVIKQPYDVAKLSMESRPVSIFQVLRKIDRGEIDLSPDFQRAFVWDKTKQSRLIESILLRIPLPAFYLDASDPKKWSVVDGLQRLTTLNRYWHNEFELENLQFISDIEGLTFEKLPRTYKVLIEDDTQLQFYNLMPGTPLEAKYTIFSRVNTGGMQLTPQEIRHALSPGKGRDLLAKLAIDPIFLNTTMGVVESKRMSDRELILRAIAFIFLGTNIYKEFNELDGFLLHALAELNVKTPSELDKIAHDFRESLEKVYSIFGKYSFRKFYEMGGRRGPLNKALFETWIFCVLQYNREDLIRKKDKIKSKFINKLNNDEKFLKSISASTGGNAAVATRFHLVETIIAEALND